MQNITVRIDQADITIRPWDGNEGDLDLREVVIDASNEPLVSFLASPEDLAGLANTFQMAANA